MTDYITPFVTWLLGSEYIRKNSLFINALRAESGNTQIVTNSVETVKTYVDGGRQLRISYTIFDFKSISFAKVVKNMVDKNENVEKYLDTQSICDYINEQNRAGNFPDFGDGYECERVYTTYNAPGVPAVDSSGNNPLAKYSVQVVCEVYFDG